MRFFLFAGLCILLGVLALSGCGPRSGGPAAISTPTAATDTPAPSTDDGTAQRNVLSAHLPALSKLGIGSEFDYVLSATMVNALYQGSGRVLYDASVVRPVSAQWGALTPGNGVRAAKLDSAVAVKAQDGLDSCVPYAFTALPGQAAMPAGQGELLRVRFKLIAPLGSSIPVRLLNDPAYLQLRDAQGQRLSFDLNEEVSAQ
jgi:hypothetical protein